MAFVNKAIITIKNRPVFDAFNKINNLEKKPAKGGNPIKENKDIVNNVELIGWIDEKPFKSTKFSIEKKFLELRKLDKTPKNSILLKT